MILVKFRCQSPGCGRLLSTLPEPLPEHVVSAPRENVTFIVKRCPQHGATLDGFRRLAKPGATVSIDFGKLQIPSDVLWGLIDTAWRTRRTQTYVV